MNELKKRSIYKLLERKKMLQDAYDSLIAEPASVSIIGSVSYTNRSMSDLQKEITAVSMQIAALINGDGTGISRAYPHYLEG